MRSLQIGPPITPDQQGLRALHDFLNESGYKVIRWREAPKKLMGESGKLVTTFVVVGQTQIPFSDDEGNSLRDWVAAGGRLVLIDRKLHNLAPESSGWTISASALEMPNIEVDPASSSQMTERCNCTATGSADCSDKQYSVCIAFSFCSAD